MEPLEIDDPGHVGRYELISRLGSDGMGRVYLARNSSGALFALNVIHQFLSDDPAFQQRFQREITAARQVTGSHTAAFADADPDMRPPWVAVEYVDGPTLNELIGDSGPLNLASAITLAAGIAQALISIHDAGLVHRDLKPSKVRMVEDGPRLIHFGIAQATGAGVLTTVRSAADSAGYMPPEQAKGDQFSPAGDVFALGAVLCFAATGRRPFGNGSIASVTHRVAYGDPDLSGISDNGLRELIADCLRKDPERRPTLQEVLRRCPAILDGSWQPGRSELSEPRSVASAQLRPRGSDRQSGLIVKTWLRPATAAAVVVAAGIGAALVLGWGGGDQASSATAAVATQPPVGSPTATEEAIVVSSPSPVAEPTQTERAVPKPTRSPKPRPTASRNAPHPGATASGRPEDPSRSPSPGDDEDRTDDQEPSAADEFWEFLLSLTTIDLDNP
ncbi:MAG TPA: protein kinase [Kineosporiaceae bacterium]|nr:protein kinase [Kineosporiaceae bacterium]